MTQTVEEIIARAITRVNKERLGLRYTELLTEMGKAAREDLLASGFAIVPVEPTEEMVLQGLAGMVKQIKTTNPIPPAEDGQVLSDQEAADRYMSIGATMRDGRDAKATWSAMLQASPGYQADALKGK